MLQEDYDQLDYVESLRESCCLTYASVVQAFVHKTDVIQPYVPKMIQLITLVATEPHSSDGLVSAALAIVGDLLTAYGAAVLPFADTEPCMALLQRCRRSKAKKPKTVAEWVNRQIMSAKRQASTGQQQQHA